VTVTRSQCSRSGRTSVAKTMSVTAWNVMKEGLPAAD
jgi:hypothetical protein